MFHVLVLILDLGQLMMMLLKIWLTFSAKGHPIVIVFSYGTSLKGACDNVKSAGERLV